MGDELRPQPKPAKRVKGKAKRLGTSERTVAKRKLYSTLARPAYLSGLAAGQERRGETPVCERCGEHPAIELHHMGGRSGNLLLDHTLFVGLCMECHDWCHERPEEAMEDGWVVSRHSVPSPSRCEPLDPGSPPPEGNGDR